MAWESKIWARAQTHNDDLCNYMNFPSVFPIKVMGANQEDFKAVVVAIIQKHANLATEEMVVSRTSRNGRFVSITVHIQAESQEQLDAIYRELSAHERVLMML